MGKGEDRRGKERGVEMESGIETFERRKNEEQEQNGNERVDKRRGIELWTTEGWRLVSN